MFDIQSKSAVLYCHLTCIVTEWIYVLLIWQGLNRLLCVVLCPQAETTIHYNELSFGV